MNESKRFFFEKNNQKTFAPDAADATAQGDNRHVRLRHREDKSFLVLFFKKEVLSCCPPA